MRMRSFPRAVPQLRRATARPEFASFRRESGKRLQSAGAIEYARRWCESYASNPPFE